MAHSRINDLDPHAPPGASTPRLRRVGLEQKPRPAPLDDDRLPCLRGVQQLGQTLTSLSG
jgi:hypothetical protein